MEAKEELITVYYGSCPRCGVKQRSYNEVNVDRICNHCFIIEENARKMEVLKQTDVLVDTNISAEMIQNIYDDSIVLDNEQGFIFTGKSGTKYNVSIIDGDECYDAKIMIEILER